MIHANWKFQISHTVLAIAALSMSSQSSGTSVVAPIAQPVGKTYLKAQKLAMRGTLVYAMRITDRLGQHALTLEREDRSTTESTRIEFRKLTAKYYLKDNKGWHRQWSVVDFVDCPGLDSVADFYLSSVGVSDLNGDGVAEVTIPYHTFCGGGVDSHTVKIILRDGEKKFAVRGESRVSIPGEEPFGGEHIYDKALSMPENGRFKQHLSKVWLTVSASQR